MEYYFGDCAIRWQISKSIKDVWSIFELTLNVSAILSFEIIDFEEIG